MKKKDFVTLIMSTVGGILFALGMCMGLLPEWDALKQGIVIGVIGTVILLAMVLVRRKKFEGRQDRSIQEGSRGSGPKTEQQSCIMESVRERSRYQDCTI